MSFYLVEFLKIEGDEHSTGQVTAPDEETALSLWFALKEKARIFNCTFRFWCDPHSGLWLHPFKDQKVVPPI